jgi:hypothetical protein
VRGGEWQKGCEAGKGGRSREEGAGDGERGGRDGQIRRADDVSPLPMYMAINDCAAHTLRVCCVRRHVHPCTCVRACVRAYA